MQLPWNEFNRGSKIEPKIEYFLALTSSLWRQRLRTPDHLPPWLSALFAGKKAATTPAPAWQRRLGWWFSTLRSLIENGLQAAHAPKPFKTANETRKRTVFESETVFESLSDFKDATKKSISYSRVLNLISVFVNKNVYFLFNYFLCFFESCEQKIKSIYFWSVLCLCVCAFGAAENWKCNWKLLATISIKKNKNKFKPDWGDRFSGLSLRGRRQTKDLGNELEIR